MKIDYDSLEATNPILVIISTVRLLLDATLLLIIKMKLEVLKTADLLTIVVYYNGP